MIARLALGVLVAALGCSTTTERGRLALVSLSALEVPVTVIDREAKGRSCATLYHARYELAVRNALIRSPGSNALVDASLGFERLCITVTGTAVHVPELQDAAAAPSE